MQNTSHLLMIRPAAFQFNTETAKSNDYQKNISTISQNEIVKTAQKEFDEFVEILIDNGVDVIVIEDTINPPKPDAVFPNNWISMHEDGTIYIFPMKTANRRIEKRMDIIDSIKKKFKVTNVVDLSAYENEDRALEGTGSMIFDHDNKLVYACLSPRTDKHLLAEFADKIDYKPVIFNSFKSNGQAQYHTNVVMCVGKSFVVICLDSITDKKERKLVEDTIKSTKKEIIEISREQLENHFAGNMLQIQNKQGDLFLVMSERALKSLNDEQLDQIQNHCDILTAPIYLIEEIGGGSARCMMAEIFLPKL
ncbi:MAG: arginine deiminase-related protein [Bacteroidota bacterium]